MDNDKIKGRDKSREFLKARGKDPDKFLPKVIPTPESLSAGASPASSAGTPKATAVIETEEQKKDKEARALEVTKAAEAEEKRILEAKDEDLSEGDKKTKKQVLILKAEEKEAKREAGIQKRIDELVGEIKSLKNDKDQDKAQIVALEADLKNLRGSVEKNPEKAKQELRRVESERISKYLTEDVELPREERREMSKEELEDWMVEDLVAAQEWLADRQLRRNQERQSDHQTLVVGVDNKAKAEIIIKKQKESQTRVLSRYPELDITKRNEELKAQGKSQQEIQKIIQGENPKIKVISEILKEDSDTYMLSENGPELLATEMERRMKIKSNESSDDRETRIREEAAETERQRQSDIDKGLDPNGSGGGSHTDSSSEFEKEDPGMFQRQLGIWKKQFPKLSESEVKARLVSRLKARKAMGAM